MRMLPIVFLFIFSIFPKASAQDEEFLISVRAGKGFLSSPISTERFDILMDLIKRPPLLLELTLGEQDPICARYLNALQNSAERSYDGFNLADEIQTLEADLIVDLRNRESIRLSNERAPEGSFIGGGSIWLRIDRKGDRNLEGFYFSTSIINDRKSNIIYALADQENADKADIKNNNSRFSVPDNRILFKYFDFEKWKKSGSNSWVHRETDRNEYIPQIFIIDQGRILFQKLSYYYIKSNPQRSQALYEVNADGIEAVCEVVTKKTKAERRKPSFLNRLMALSTDIIGKQCDTGSMPTHMNAVNRGREQIRRLYIQPWNVVEGISSNRKDVIDQYLEYWSFTDPFSRAKYLALAQEYNQSLRELMKHLIFAFNVPPGQYAEELADALLFRAFAQYWSFSRHGFYSFDAVDTTNFSFGVPSTLPTNHSEGIRHIIADIYRGRLSAEELQKRFEQQGSMNRQKQHALLVATINQPDLLAMLIALGIPIDIPNQFGKTALMYAVQLDKVDAVQRLLNLGADPSAETFDRASHSGSGCISPGGRSRSVSSYAVSDHVTSLLETAQTR